MALTLWGLTPLATTTVSASPAPTTSVFTVASVVNLRVGQTVVVQIGVSTFEATTISGISGSQLTVSPALSTAPTAGFTVEAFGELLTNSHINAGAMWKELTLTSLRAASDDGLTSDPPTLVWVEEVKSIFSWDSASTDDDNDVTIIKLTATSGAGRFIKGTGQLSQFDSTGTVTMETNGEYFANSDFLVKYTLPPVAGGGKVTVIGSGVTGFMLEPDGSDPVFTPGDSIPTNGTALFNDQQYTAVTLSANTALSRWVVSGGSGTYTIRNPGYRVTTFAGNSVGSADGTGTAAQFNSPTGIVTDSSGNVYIADLSNHRIRKSTYLGVVTTFVGNSSGSADGTGTAAQFNNPSGLVLDSALNLYVADKSNHRIRKVTTAGVVTTLAGSSAGFSDGTGTAAQFNNPQDVTMDSAGNIYVADTSNHRIRKVTSAGVVTTLAGSASGSADGTGTAAQFNSPVGIATDSAQNLFVVDAVNHRIRKVTTAGVVTTFAGNNSGYTDGTGTAAQFNGPFGIATDSAGNVYVTDSANNRVRKITSAGVVTTIAGSGSSGTADGIGTAAEFNGMKGAYFHSADTLYICNDAANRIRKILDETA